MTVKARLALGIAFLLSVIMVLSILATYYLDNLEQRNAAVYRANFSQLTRVESVIGELNALTTSLLKEDSLGLARSVQRFQLVSEQNLARLNGIDGSVTRSYVLDRVTDDIQAVLDSLSSPNPTPIQRAVAVELMADINAELHTLFAENEQAVEFAFRQNEITTASAKTQMALVGGLCSLFAVLVLVWLPGYVTSPIQGLADSIQQISEGNFNIRLPTRRKDEFGKLATGFNTMAARLQKYSEQNVSELIDSRNRLSSLVNQLNEYILGIDRERKIVFINAPMAEHLDLTEEDALGKYLPDLALAAPRLQRLFEPIALGKTAAIDPFTDTRPDGTQLYLQERVINLTDEHEKPNGYIIILTDVTEYEERTHRQSDFLATLSHEMKTPIAAIKMGVNLLEDDRLGALDEDQKELTGTIRDNSERLLRMVNEVLQLSEQEVAGTHLTLDTLELAALVDEVEAEVKPLLTKKSLSLDVKIPQGAYRIEADRQRIGWVLNNLLSNAIRYSPVGGSIRIEQATIPGGVLLSVSDEGAGVPADERERIFEKYTRAKNDTTKGTGLGLAISREYVESHGGRIYVDGTYTVGARFILELPRRLSSERRDANAITAAP